MDSVKEKLVELLCKIISPTITVGEQADFLIAHGVTVQEWISVKDRLPEPKENPVLVYYANTVWAAWKHGNYWELTPGLNTTCVTHWMPMPQPPKRE